MGLDMYLEARNYLSSYDEDDMRVSDAVGQAASTGDFRVKSVVLEVGYWRKSNQIHKWFVDNVQDGEDDCKDYYVTADKIKELLSVTKQVLADHSKAPELLPTGEGFFFGSTEYEDYYFEDLAETVEILEKALTLSPQEWSFYYSSSW